MRLEIKERKKNPLMKREEALVSIEHGGKATPNRKHVLDEMSKLLKARPECIIIDRIITQGGKAFSEAKVFAYSKKEDIPAWRLKKMEQRLAKAKKKPEEKPAKAPEAKPEEAKPAEEEKPAESKEEKPEAPKPEEKPEEGKPSEEETKEEAPPETAPEEKEAPEEKPEEKSEEKKEEAPKAE
jgi:ribosomal protein S24E